MSRQRAKYILAELSRILLVALLLFSGFVKGVDPVGGAIKIEEYLRVMGLGNLREMAPILSVALCSFEFILGGCLLMGLWKRLVAWATTIFMGVMTLLTLYLALFNPISDCGCFGDALKLTNWQTFAKNVLFMGITVVYHLTYRTASHPLRGGFAMGAFVLLLVGWGVFVGWNLRHLPLIDFRPYKVGASLRDLTMIPEDAPREEIEYLFIYEKNGLRETFNMDNLPDYSWTYIDRQEHVISEGYKPPVMDFAIYAGGGTQGSREREVTQTLLMNESPQIWVVTPNWETTSIRASRKLNALYDWAESLGIAMYGISGSTPEESGRWRNKTAAAYPLYFCDATTIKTMARAQPTMLLVSDGVIVDKRAVRDLPDEYSDHSYERLSMTLQQAPHAGLHIERWGLLALWLICCLVALIQAIQWEDKAKYSEYQIKNNN